MKIFTTLLLLISMLRLMAQTADTTKLKDALINLERNNSQINQRIFFELFPNTFGSFEQTFGYNYENTSSLYDGYEFIVKFFSLDSIPETEQFNKWIDISIDGHWDADAVGHFQRYLRSRILNNVELVYTLLKERNEQEIESFFYFFFNEIHPQFKTIPKEFETIKAKDKNIYRLLEKGQKRAIEDSGQ